MKDPDKEMSPEFLWQMKRRDAERAHDQHDQFFTQVNEATISNGTLAVRTAILINGGAAVALLAFIGSLLGDGKLPISKAVDLTSSLIWFASGVAFAALGVGAAYFTNYSIAGATVSKVKRWDHPWIADGPRTKYWMLAAYVFQFIAIGVTVTSLACFLFGMLDVRNSIIRVGT